MAHEFPEIDDEFTAPYRIAIPTYNRPRILREKTLALIDIQWYTRLAQRTLY